MPRSRCRFECRDECERGPSSNPNITDVKRKFRSACFDNAGISYRSTDYYVKFEKHEAAAGRVRRIVLCYQCEPFYRKRFDLYSFQAGANARLPGIESHIDRGADEIVGALGVARGGKSANGHVPMRISISCAEKIFRTLQSMPGVSKRRNDLSRISLLIRELENYRRSYRNSNPVWEKAPYDSFLRISFVQC